MPNAPHVHSVDEVKANISRIEHNSGSGKKTGPPMAPAGGSAKNRNSGSVPCVTSHEKGDDYVGKRSI